MNTHSVLLDASDVRAVVLRVGLDALMDDLIARLRTAIERYDAAVTQVPPRGGVYYEQPEWGLLECMPAHVGTEGTTVKLVGYHPGNPERRGLPSVVSTLCVFDTSSGHLVGVLDGTLLTAMRTGAASAVASQALASPESRTLGIIGCGAQAVTQIHALSRMFTLTSIVAHDVREEAARTLAARVPFVDASVRVVGRDALDELLTSADILCTCTSAAPREGPLFEDFENRPHLHVNAVGSDFRGKWELPLSLLRRSLVCPDFREQAAAEGECQQLEADAIGPDLLALLQTRDDYRDAPARLTVFDSTGWALEDHVAALMMLDYARDLGLGRSVMLECLSPDPADPYSLVRVPDVAAALAAWPGQSGPRPPTSAGSV